MSNFMFCMRSSTVITPLWYLKFKMLLRAPRVHHVKRVRSSSTDAWEAAKAVRAMELWRSKGRCVRCWLPQASCMCQALAPLATTTRCVDVAVVMHHKEYGKAKNTARLLPIVLPDAATIVVHRAEPLPPQRPGSAQLLLFPGEGSEPAADWRAWVSQQRERVTLLVVDGTWSQVRAVARSITDVPRIHVSDVADQSLVDNRRQPRLGAVSTLEAVALALRELGEVHAEAPLVQALRHSLRVQDELMASRHSAAYLALKRAKHQRQRTELLERRTRHGGVPGLTREADVEGDSVGTKSGEK